MAWLDDNPPRHQQFRCPRRESKSGVIGIHTAESFPDETGPDDGAENVARFIRDRTNYGSYHDICDSDSIVHLVRDDCVAYHIATFGINEHSYGISAATQAHKWDDLDSDWVDATVRNMARAAARYAKRNSLDIPARWLSASQAANRVPGFVRHSVADPDRRRDPGATFPANTFFAYYLEEIGDDDMPSPKDWDTEDHVAIRKAIYGENHYLKYNHMSRDVRGTGPKNIAWFMRTIEARQHVLLDAIKDIPGVDTDALADKLNRLDEDAIAEAVADEHAERMSE